MVTIKPPVLPWPGKTAYAGNQPQTAGPGAARVAHQIAVGVQVAHVTHAIAIYVALVRVVVAGGQLSSALDT